GESDTGAFSPSHSVCSDPEHGSVSHRNSYPRTVSFKSEVETVPGRFRHPGTDTEKPGRSSARARTAGSSARGKATYHQLRPLRREAIARVTMGTPFPCFLSSS